MRQLLSQKERSKRKGEEAPSGCNYLPHLNNAFVMIIIERSLTASTWDLTRPSEKLHKKICKFGDWQSCLPGQPGAAGTGTTVSRRPLSLWGSRDAFPDVASPFPTLSGATPKCRRCLWVGPA